MEENPNPVVTTRRQQILNSVVEGNKLVHEFQYREADAGLLFQYIVYDVLGERVIGTVVIHQSIAAAQQSRALAAPAFSIEGGHGLVYGCLYMDIDDYISELTLNWTQKSVQEKARDKKAATDHALGLFQNIAEIVRNQIVSQAPPFPGLEDFFGLTETGNVEVLRASINDPRATYSENLKDLATIARKLKRYLEFTVGGDEYGGRELCSFVEFVGHRNKWYSLPVYTIDYITSYHPATINLVNNVRLIFNIGELFTKPQDTNSLLHSRNFKTAITSMLRGWYSSADKHPQLTKVLNYENGYRGEEVARFVTNALKHCARRSKEEIIRTLESRIGRFRHFLLYSYVEALHGGYTNPDHDYTQVCSGYI